MATNPTVKIPVVLYNGTVNIDFYPNSHAYKLNGDRLSGVTTIGGIVDKSRPLMIWQGRLIENYLKGIPLEHRTDKEIEYALTLSTVYKDKGADIGTVIHEMIDKHIKGEEFDVKDEVSVLLLEDQGKAKNGYLAFLKWEAEAKPEWLENEKIVYSKKFGYVGTFDAICKIDGKVYLVDFKSASGFYEFSHRLQTSAYAKAYMEEYPDKQIEGRLILLCIKEDKKNKAGDLVNVAGEMQVYDISSELDQDFVSFVSAQNLYKRNKIFDKYEK